MSSEQNYTFEDYLNCDLLDVHRWSDYPEVVAARTTIIKELGFRGTKKEVTHVTVVLLNLYRTYCLDPDMWVLYSRDRNDYNYGHRYNKLFIKYDNLIKAVDGLLKLDYIEHAIGYQDRKTKKAYASRMKATQKLVAVIEKQYAVTFNMIGEYAPDELIVLRDADGEPIDYVDTREIKRMRSVLEKYNDLLKSTYIDIHFEPADIQDLITKRRTKKNPLTGEPKKYKPNVNLSNKRVRRIFNKSTFSKGGRFYGGWWQNIPSQLRKHIIIGTDYTVEIDYSGLHIYMLYALKGINFADLGKEPYIYPKGNDPSNCRAILKVLLLAAVNSGSEDECIKAVRYEINMNRSAFSDDLPDLKETYGMFREYHSVIADMFCSKSGLKLQRWDSDIAEEVIEIMTAKAIPVLVVHDSFICIKEEADLLEDVMLKVYHRHASKLGVATGALTRLSSSPIATKASDLTKELPDEHKDEDILINHLTWMDKSQARRLRRYLLYEEPSTNVVIKVSDEVISEVGAEIEDVQYEQVDWLIHDI